MKIPAPLKLGLNFNSLLAAGTFLLPVSVNAIHFPDLLQLQSDYRATSPKVGKPVDLFQKKGGDSNSVHLEWMGSTIQSVRYEQSTEFNLNYSTALFPNLAEVESGMKAQSATRIPSS